MSIRIYAINLDGLVDRWSMLSRRAKALAFPLSASLVTMVRRYYLMTALIAICKPLSVRMVARFC